MKKIMFIMILGAAMHFPAVESAAIDRGTFAIDPTVLGDFERSGDLADDYGYNRINLGTGFKFYL